MAASNDLPGSVVGRFRLVERLGGPRSSMWTAEDDRGRQVVLDILARTLPADPARRSALVQRIRQRAALHHLGIVAIHDVLVDGETLAIQLERVEATPLDSAPKPLHPAPLLKIAWQLADTLAWLHQKGFVHGTLSPGNVLITEDGDARIGGLSLAALSGRPDRGEDRLLKSTDPEDVRALVFRAPEQILGKPPDERTDVYSLGAVLFHAATGADPFEATTAADAAAAVVRTSPPSPQQINPRVAGKIADIIGRCLPKDPYRRYGSARLILDDLRKIDPSLPQTAARTINTLTRRAEAARLAETPFVVARLPYFELLEATDPAKASRLSARMHQFLGEAVLLADGRILDSLGARFVATLPSADAALDAVRRALRDLAEQNAEHERDGEILEPTILVHAGEVLTTGAAVSGEPLELATRISDSMEPGQALATDPIAVAAAITDRVRKRGDIEGIGLWPIDLEAPGTVDAPAEATLEPEPEPEAKPPAAAPPAPAAAPPAPRRDRRILWLGSAAALALMVVALVLILPRRSSSPEGARVAAGTRAGTASPGAPEDGGIHLSGFASVPADPALAARAAAVEDAVRRMLAALPGIRIADEASPASRRFGARSDPEGPPERLIAVDEEAETDGPAVSLDQPGAAAAEIARWIAASHGIAAERVGSADPEALASFVEALEILAAPGGDGDPRALLLLQQALAEDPRFVAAAQTALPLLEATGDRSGAIGAAELVIEADPGNEAMRRRLFGWRVEQREIAPALRHAAVLAERSGDREALLFIGRHALSAGDEETFRRVLPRIESAWGARTPLHAADWIAAQGRFGVAVQQYYAVEPNQPENAALALKVGRIGVLRHSLPVAEFELQKLETLDPSFGAPLLRAFIAAEKREAATARRELAAAARAATPDHGLQTAAAEIHALLSDHPAVLQSIRQAVETREPTLAYIEANPLFRYLADDAPFMMLRDEIDRAQAEIREGLAAAR